MSAKPQCFIIMPISVREDDLDKYRDGADHFAHVLECLHKPSVEQAGYEPIPPGAEGSDLIQAGIIKNLEEADIVLCDISGWNANVFFEFGIRTSLNKPVCIVKDELTDGAPFDINPLQYEEYQSAFEAWNVDAEREKLAKHIAASAKKSDGANNLWKYFGLRSEVKPYHGAEGEESKLDLLAMKVDSVATEVAGLREGVVLYGRRASGTQTPDEKTVNEAIRKLTKRNSLLLRAAKSGNTTSVYALVDKIIEETAVRPNREMVQALVDRELLS